MKYKDLTLNQRISLKGEFHTNPECIVYKAIMCLWDFVTAVEFFLNDDVDLLKKGLLGVGLLDTASFILRKTMWDLKKSKIVDPMRRNRVIHYTEQY